MLRTPRNSLAPSGLPLCAVRNSTLRNQRPLVRTIHSSRKNSEGEPTSERPRGYEGFSNRLPSEIRSPGNKWSKPNTTGPIATGNSGIDRAILSSFPSPKNTGASSWPKGEGTSGPLRINRAPRDRQGGTRELEYIPGQTPRFSFGSKEGYTPGEGYSTRNAGPNRWQPRDTGQYRPVQDQLGGLDGTQSGTYQGFTREGRPPIQSIPSASLRQNIYPPRDAYTQRDGFTPKNGYIPRDQYPPRGRYPPRDRYPTSDTYTSRNAYTSRDANGKTIQRANTSNGYQAQERRPTTEGAELIVPPPDLRENEYEKRQAGKARDKARGRRVFDESESAILEEETSKQDKKAARRAMKAKKRENRNDTPRMIPLYLPEFISVPNLAKALKVRLEDFLEQMKDMGFTDMSHDHILNAETAGLIAMEYNFEPIADNSKERDLLPRPPAEDRSILPPRPPVVTIMGHVDHGKTSLLDWFRKASVAASEHGGITQHIGAFSVIMPSGKNITFLDTPGHEAFLSMRERGANVTDIVILVVAADDSVKPQTIEAIKHARAANVPIIVAANKIDKEESDVERVKQDLARYGVDVEDYGGDTQVVPVSAKSGQGMEELEEATITLSEVLDMRAEDDGPCEGWVLEAGIKPSGRVATVLVRRGTLRVGDALVAGKTWAKVRQLVNEHGVKIDSAGPGTPVEVFGWKDQPEAGELAIQAESEEKAKDVIDFRQEKAERLRQAADIEAINEKRRLHRQKEEAEAAIREVAKEKGEDPEAAVLAYEKTAKLEVDAQPKSQEVTLVVKGDVAGSVEAVVNAISTLGNDEVAAKVSRSSFGNVSEFDVDYAAAVEGYIVCFNLTVDPEIVLYARNKGVTILSHNIIYHLVEDVKRQLSDRLPPTVIHTVKGEAEISQIFSINTKKKQYKQVAGCKVKVGVIAKHSKVRVVRGGKIIFEGMLDSLKNIKEDVTEMRKGNECGMGFEGWGEFEVGDLVQCFETKLEPRSL